LVTRPLNCGVATVSVGYNVLPKSASLLKGITVKLNIESEREDDGRWLAEVPEPPEVLAYGASRDDEIGR
jgi:hypothetical protein